MKCSPEAFRLLHAVFGDFARAFPGTTALEWKAALLTLAPAFIAQADGRPIPTLGPRRSTLELSTGEVNEAIECCMWLGAELGVSFLDRRR